MFVKTSEERNLIRYKLSTKGAKVYTGLFDSTGYSMCAKLMSTFAATLKSLIENQTNRETQAARNDRKIKTFGGYDYIPVHTVPFSRKFFTAAMYKMYILEQARITEFLDAGSGPGVTLLFSRSIEELMKKSEHMFPHFGRMTGLEIDQELVSTGNILLLQHSYTNIITQNILTYSNYNQCDMIYYFCPIQFDSFQMLFEELVEDKASENTILMPELKRGYAIQHDRRFTKIVVNLPDGGNTWFFVKNFHCAREVTSITDEIVEKDVMYAERNKNNMDFTMLKDYLVKTAHLWKAPKPF